jgi:hypothetical protein
VLKIRHYAKPQNVTSKPKRRHDRQQTSKKMTDKMPTLRKIKRAASQHTSQRFCSTFNFAHPHPSPPTTLTVDKGQFEGNF